MVSIYFGAVPAVSGSRRVEYWELYRLSSALV